MGKRRKPTRADAGRKGGRATLRKHGAKFYARIGRKGGKAGKGRSR